MIQIQDMITINLNAIYHRPAWHSLTWKSLFKCVVYWLSLLLNFIQLSLNSGSAQVQTLRCVGDSRWWGSLTMVPSGNKVCRSTIPQKQFIIIIISIIIITIIKIKTFQKSTGKVLSDKTSSQQTQNILDHQKTVFHIVKHYESKESVLIQVTSINIESRAA